ncbi:MAG: ABC transporter permease [Bacteroidales bacterium]|nr:ABC transporter permease [Bacteroidales bacterium]MBQ4196668.1 ABC transporter permease [Bacteroidales bacterium]
MENKRKSTNMLQCILNVLLRERDIMSSRPIYLYGTILVLSFCAIFFVSLMYQGLPQRVPVGVVDMDDSYLSRTAIKQIEAMQGIEITNRYGSYHEARLAMQKGEIYGFIEFPEDLYVNVVNGLRPTVPVYYTEAYMVPGTLAYRNLLQIANVLNAGVRRTTMRAKGVPETSIMPTLQPITIDTHSICNPWSSYAIYLISIIWPGILSLCIIVMTVFTIGFELKQKTTHDLLEKAGGSIINALIGKLLPYFLIYLLMGFSFVVLAYRIFGFPLLGPTWVMLLNIAMLILASHAVGLFFIGLFPVLRDALSAASLYSVLALSMCGMTFPVEMMIAPMQGFAQIFPLRQYYLIYVKWAMLDCNFPDVYINLLGMCIFLFLPFLVLRRLKDAMVNLNYPTK